MGSRTPIAYLDTNHLSRLVREPEAEVCVQLLEVFRSERAFLGSSVFALIEASDPAFTQAPEVGELLDQPFVRWAKPAPMIFSDEMSDAITSYLGGLPRRQVFYDTLGAALGDARLDKSPSVFLQTLMENPDMRAGKDEAARQAVGLDRFKTRAAVHRDPIEPLAAMMDDRGTRRTPAGIELPRALDPREIIDAVGGLSAFPAYEVWNAMHRDRLGNTTFTPDPNDVIDELHAVHAPYCDVIALDRRTLARLRNTRLRYIERATRRLEDVPDLLRSVEAV